MESLRVSVVSDDVQKRWLEHQGLSYSQARSLLEIVAHRCIRHPTGAITEDPPEPPQNSDVERAKPQRVLNDVSVNMNNL